MSKCENCEYSAAQQAPDGGNGSDNLTCRRFPPVPSVITGTHPMTGQPVAVVQTVSPIVPPDGWCGEYLPQGESGSNVLA